MVPRVTALAPCRNALAEPERATLLRQVSRRSPASFPGRETPSKHTTPSRAQERQSEGGRTGPRPRLAQRSASACAYGLLRGRRSSASLSVTFTGAEVPGGWGEQLRMGLDVDRDDAGAGQPPTLPEVLEPLPAVAPGLAHDAAAVDL